VSDPDEEQSYLEPVPVLLCILEVLLILLESCGS
jgi:hypothetical protein